MLFLIGLGLFDENDLSLRAIEAIKSCHAIYCELYTANWQGDLKKLEKIAGRKIQLLPREIVESDFLLREAKKKNIALLVPGDPLVATTHYQLIVDTKKNKIKTQIIHSSSIYTAVAETGLSIYKFGRTTTLAYPEHGYEPQSPYDMILQNRRFGLHTLVLLDTQKGGMTISDAIDILSKMDKEEILKRKIVIAANLGGSPIIKYGYAHELKIDEHGTVIVPGILNYNEEEALKLWE